MLLGLILNKWVLDVIFPNSIILSLISTSVLRGFNIFVLLVGFSLIVFRKNQSFARAIKVIGVNVCILLVGLIAIELSFGDWISPSRLNRLNIIKNSTFYFDISGLYPSPQKIIKFTKDSSGFRGTYVKGRNIDILTIGGSTTDQRYIADGATWQDVLHDEFRKNGKDVYVVNAGVDGQTSYGNIKNFEWWFPSISGLKVRYFLFYLGLNDFYRGEKNIYDDIIGGHHRLVRIKIAIKNQSALYYLYRTFFGILKVNASSIGHGADKDFSTEGWTDKPLIKDHYAVMKTKLKSYGKRLEILCQQARTLGARPIFVTQTKRSFSITDNKVRGINKVNKYNGIPYNSVDEYYMISLMNQKLMEVCKKNNGVCIDLASELVFDPITDYYDLTHNTPVGTKKIGKFLYEKLSPLF